MRVIVSSCLMGDACRYDGNAKPNAAVLELCERVEAMGVCPETASGLPVPRLAAEQRDGRVYLSDGTDVTSEFLAGAEREVRRLEEASTDGASADGASAGGGLPRLAILKAKSPSCGSGFIYDGTYTSSLTKGDGVFAARLMEKGVCVVDEKVVESCKPSVEHPVALVLGSGLGHLVGLVKPVRRIDYHDIDGFPQDARPVRGHRFEAIVGDIDGVPVIVYPGRVHLYQGYSAAEVTALVRHAHRLGCRDIVFACATGAISGMAPMGLGIITDHINLTGRNPLAEIEAKREVDTPFVSMGEAYSPYMRALAKGVADDLGIEVSEGVLASLIGPSFETPAEIRALATLGVSYVGMSIVCETIMARALGMNVLGLTLATNVAGEAFVSHDSVLAVAERHAEDFERLVRGVLALL